MNRQFIYLSLHTIPIDNICGISLNEENSRVDIATEKTTYYENLSTSEFNTTQEIYDDILSQIKKAERPK